MFKIKDIVRYKTPLALGQNWGVITEIFTVSESFIESNRGVTFYRIESLERGGMTSHYNAKKEDIIEGYSKYYDGECSGEDVNSNICNGCKLEHCFYIPDECFKCEKIKRKRKRA